ncbi:MAG: leucine-rich repeat domain-containing protein, partial [Dolichospermum sp.]
DEVTELDLSNNQISSLPPEIVQLTNLNCFQ